MSESIKIVKEISENASCCYGCGCSVMYLLRVCSVADGMPVEDDEQDHDADFGLMCYNCRILADKEMGLPRDSAVSNKAETAASGYPDDEVGRTVERQLECLRDLTKLIMRVRYDEDVADGYTSSVVQVYSRAWTQHTSLIPLFEAYLRTVLRVGGVEVFEGSVDLDEWTAHNCYCDSREPIYGRIRPQ
jgi:hypothetical protein